MSPDMVGLSILLLGLLLLLGKVIRYRSRLAQNLFLPSSIIGGALALLAGPFVLGGLAEALGGDGAMLSEGLWPEEIIDVWSELPGLLISVVFATLFLGHRIPGPRQILAYGGPQLTLGLSMGAGQYVVGILLAIVVLGPVFGLPPITGALIEVGFEGGHGTAAGLGDTFANLGFEDGTDLALGLATVGVMSGVALGIALINWGVRTGRTTQVDDVEMSLAQQRGVYERDDRDQAAIMTVRPSSIEPLSIHFAVVALAVLIGQIFLWILQWLEATLWGPAGVEIIEYVPLFPLAMLGGLVVQLLIQRLDRMELVDRLMMMRVQGLALDVLIVAALGSLSLQVIFENLVPFLLLAGVGVGWNVFVFLFFARRMIPEFWFERGIGDLGQSLGVTATGLILMRVVDPENRTPALEAFGYKQLGFEPFFGGGLVTALSVPFIAQFGPYPLLAIMTVLLLASLAVGVLYFGRMESARAEVSG
jgi:glutamate:Na+ symporter, ESS family